MATCYRSPFRTTVLRHVGDRFVPARPRCRVTRPNGGALAASAEQHGRRASRHTSCRRRPGGADRAPDRDDLSRPERALRGARDRRRQLQPRRRQPQLRDRRRRRRRDHERRSHRRDQRDRVLDGAPRTGTVELADRRTPQDRHRQPRQRPDHRRDRHDDRGGRRRRRRRAGGQHRRRQVGECRAPRRPSRRDSGAGPPSNTRSRW